MVEMLEERQDVSTLQVLICWSIALFPEVILNEVFIHSDSGISRPHLIHFIGGQNISIHDINIKVRIA